MLCLIPHLVNYIKYLFDMIEEILSDILFHDFVLKPAHARVLTEKWAGKIYKQQTKPYLLILNRYECGYLAKFQVSIWNVSEGTLTDALGIRNNELETEQTHDAML